MWDTMLGPGPHALIAPYYAGAKPLPTEDDLRRLADRTPHVYCTAPPLPKRSRRRPGVDKMIRLQTEGLREVRREMGQVRLRRPLDGADEWSIELFGGVVRYDAAARV